jgi:uncharacterized damage-inducible protein DinB
MSMSEIDQIVHELKCAFDGEAWHGPALMEILDGVDAKAALDRPIATAHTIWELVLHVTGWERVITRRLHGEKLVLSDAENFGHITDTSDTAWKQAVTKLRQTHKQLIEDVSNLAEEKLNARTPGKPYDLRFMLHGAAQHAAYHGGQIALLKRARA